MTRFSNILASKSRVIMNLFFFIVIIFLLGQCQQIISNHVTESAKNKDIIEKAKATAMKYLKNKYKLDVEITKDKIHPTHVATAVVLEGNVIGNKNEFFTISVNYKSNEIRYLSMSPELVEAIRAKGYDPYIKQKHP
ncbi:hypothetical protein [Paenibacillus faecalis]|uniref:hypothetical protein n=1 Tax=Paenibacillus faecalis TaxID=2079532 RepID=UPI000D103173|nr:hypothetical protein [Paenibacillus faecalis]